MARAGKYSFIIEQGSTFNRQIQYTDSNGSPVDLTGYNARMQIRQTYDSNVTIINLSSTSIGADGSGIVIDPSSGSISITISAASSSVLSFNGEAVFDLEIYSGSGASQYVKRLIEGKVKISREVTR
jgi:hypothetical protein